MRRDRVEKLLALIHACQDAGQIWIAQIVFAYILDRFSLEGLPARVWVDYLDHIEQGCLVVVGTKYAKGKCMSARLLSNDFRRRLSTRRRWGQGLLPIRPHEEISRQSALALSEGQVLAPPSQGIVKLIVELSDRNTQELLTKARGYFCIHPPAFEQALAVFQSRH